MPRPIRRAGASLVASILALSSSYGCTGEPKGTPSGPSAPAQAAALGGEAARVGDVSIPRALVLAVARARGLSAKDATTALIDDALLAEAAKSAGADNDANLARAHDAALARALAAKARTEALAQGDWTDAELDALTAAHKLEIDRPEARQVVHALVPKDVPGGEELAARLRERLADVKADDPRASEKAFLAAASAFALPDGKKVIAETIPYFTREGHLLSGGDLAKPFAEAAFALEKPMDTSGVVPTQFGWHVIRLVSILPPHVATRDEKIEHFAGELLAARVKKTWDPMLERLRAQAKIAVVATDSDLALPR